MENTEEDAQVGGGGGIIPAGETAGTVTGGTVAETAGAVTGVVSGCESGDVDKHLEAVCMGSTFVGSERNDKVYHINHS